MQAIRDKLLPTWDRPGERSNAGLLMARYLQVAFANQSEEFRTARDRLHEAIRPCGGATLPIYQMAFDRWRNSLPQPSEDAEFTVANRLIVGLGGDNVLETGLTLHHTYGTPIIPGSALKGLAAHFCEEVWGEFDARFRHGGEIHRVLFGENDSGGFIQFHDAWLTPGALADGSSGILPDVLTTHHREYYRSTPDHLVAPTDFDDANPVAFLSVRGSFHVAISVYGTGAASSRPGTPAEDPRLGWRHHAFELLEAALREWGVGGKTNSGYGRLVRAGRTALRVGVPIASDAPVGPRFQPGDIVQVKVVRDKNGKLKYQASDCFLGHIVGKPPAESDEGREGIELWIANRSKTGYTFSETPTKAADKSRRPPKGRR